MSETQKQKILDHIAKYGSITTYEGFTECGCTKLTTRISELRRDGYPIISELVVTKNKQGKTVRYNRYRLAD